MLKIVSVLFFILMWSNASAQLKKSGSLDSVKNTIQVFFTGLNTKDTNVLKSCIYDSIVLETAYQRKDNTTFIQKEDIASFMKSISSIPANVSIEEKIINAFTSVDGVLATAWLPYTFSINKTLSHCGANLFTLVRFNGVWKITHIIDSRRKDCTELSKKVNTYAK
jgi:hypothetical protein